MENILKYQDIDRQIFKLEREISTNEYKKQATALVGHIKDTQNKVLELEKLSSQMLGEVDKLRQVEKKGVSLVEKYIKQVSESQDMAELKEIQAKLKQTTSQLTELENRLLSWDSKAKRVVRDFDNAKKKLASDRISHQQSKEKFTEYYNAKKPQLDELKQKLLEQEKLLDPAFLNRYRALRQDGIFPVLVPMVESRCGGCRMGLSSNEVEKISVAGKLECPSCHRLIYIKKN